MFDGLTTDHDLTAQQVFDTVRDHLRRQGRRSMREGGCAYRSPEGLRCAVGVLIRDDEYRVDMEAKIVTKLIHHGMLPPRLRPHAALLTALQCVHDTVPPNIWEEQLRWVAANHGLEWRD